MGILPNKEVYEVLTVKCPENQTLAETVCIYFTLILLGKGMNPFLPLALSK